jgi:hypothetical protein
MTISAVDLGSMVTFSSSGASRWRIASNGVARLLADWTRQDPPISRMPEAGSGLGHNHAFDDALAQVGWFDREIDRLCVRAVRPFQPSHHAGCRRDPFQTLSPVALTPGHQDPRNPHNLVGQLRSRYGRVARSIRWLGARPRFGDRAPDSAPSALPSHVVRPRPSAEFILVACLREFRTCGSRALLQTGRRP